MEKVWIYEQSSDVKPFEEQDPKEWFYLEETMMGQDTVRFNQILHSFYQEYNPDNYDTGGLSCFEWYGDAHEEINRVYDEWVNGNLSKRFNIWGNFKKGSPALTKSVSEMDKKSAAWLEIEEKSIEEATKLAWHKVSVGVPVLPIIKEFYINSSYARSVASAIACIYSQEETKGVPLKAKNMPWCRLHQMDEKDPRVSEELDKIQSTEEYAKRLFFERCMAYDGEPDKENPTLAKNWNIKQGTPYSNSLIIGKWGSWENFVSDALGENKITKTGKASLWMENWLAIDRWSYKGLLPTKVDYQSSDIFAALSLIEIGNEYEVKRVFKDVFDIEPVLEAKDENVALEKAALVERIISRTKLSSDVATSLVDKNVQGALDEKARAASAVKVAVSVSNIGDMPDIPDFLKREAS